MKNLFYLFLITVSSSLYAHPDLKILSNRGDKYIARPIDKKISFCPNYRLSTLFMLQMRRNIDCIRSLSSSPSTEEVRGCFVKVVQKTYHYDDLQLLGLPMSCIKKLYRGCIGVTRNSRGGIDGGILGSFLMASGNRPNFTEEDGVNTCKTIFYNKF